MANKVTLKRSSVAGKIPQVADLDYGEVALNFTDGRLYFRNSNDEIEYFSKVALTNISDFFDNDSDLGLVVNPITDAIDLGSVADAVNDSYDLGLVYIGGTVFPDALILQTHTISTLPSGIIGQIVYLSDDVGGPTLAFYDGSNWRRTSDNQVVASS